MIKLRSYQIDAVNALWKELFSQSAALCVAPCGSGKTEIIFELIRRALAKPGIKIVVLVGRVMLVEQTRQRAAAALGEDLVSVYCGSLGQYDTTKPIVIASVQSIHDVPLSSINLVILDEVHNVDQLSGRYIEFIQSNQAKNPKMKVVAFTASPYRSNGYIYGEGKLFPRVTYKRTLKQMFDEGHLVKPIMKRVNYQFDTSKLRVRMGEFVQEDVNELVSDKEKLKLQVSDALERMKDRKVIVWQCASIEHCTDVFIELSSRGESVGLIHSRMHHLDRVYNQSRFESGEIRHLCFISIIGEAYNFEPIDCIVLLRPVRSPVVYVQTVGRGMRTYPGKADCLVLDFGRVVETLGPIDNPLVNEGSGTKRKPKPIPMRFCKECLSYTPISALECPDCGYLFNPKLYDPTRNLTIKANEEAHILSEEKKGPKTFDVSKVTLDIHESKAGNACLKISYYSPNFLLAPIHEYFSYSADFAYRKAQNRLIELGCELHASLGHQVMAPIKRVPKAITYVRNGQYEQVTGLQFL